MDERSRTLGIVLLGILAVGALCIAGACALADRPCPPTIAATLGAALGALVGLVPTPAGGGRGPQ